MPSAKSTPISMPASNVMGFVNAEPAVVFISSTEPLGSKRTP